MRFKLNPSAIGRQWVVYSVSINNGPIEFIGMCPAAKLMVLPDLQTHPRYASMFFGKDLTVEVLIFCANPREAQNYRWTYFQTVNYPEMNRTAAPLSRGHKIYCYETGESFMTIDQVVAAHGCSSSQLSGHLRGLPGFKTVKGKTYRRGLPPPAVPSHTQ